MRKLAFYIIIISLITLAGCNTSLDTAQTTEPTQRTTILPSEEPVTIRVEGDTQSVNVNRTFARVQQLTDSSVEPPEHVTFKPGANAAQFRYSLKSHPFFELMGADSSNLHSTVRGQALDDSVTVAYTNEATDEQVEHVLAHEFAHVVQRRTGFRDTVIRQFDDDYSQTTDGQLARESVIEGSAEYVATEYNREYVQDGRMNDTVPWKWESASLSASYFWAPYRYGARYADRRLDSPSQLDELRQSPPRTTEQVLHGYLPDDEPPAQLQVRSNDSDSNWGLTVRDTVGELTVRLVLATELDVSAAVRGSTGWGNDEVLTYHSGSSSGFVWVTRWDDAANASTFEETFKQYLSRRATESDGGWHDGDDHFRVVRSSEDTVVVFAGPESFVRNATIEIDGHDVAVVPPS